MHSFMSAACWLACVALNIALSSSLFLCDSPVRRVETLGRGKKIGPRSGNQQTCTSLACWWQAGFSSTLPLIRSVSGFKLRRASTFVSGKTGSVYAESPSKRGEGGQVCLRQNGLSVHVVLPWVLEECALNNISLTMKKKHTYKTNCISGMSFQLSICYLVGFYYAVTH